MRLLRRLRQRILGQIEVRSHSGKDRGAIARKEKKAAMPSVSFADAFPEISS